VSAGDFGKPLATRTHGGQRDSAADRKDRPRAAEFCTWHDVRVGKLRMRGKGLPRQIHPGDVTVSPILGTGGLYVYGEIVDRRVHGCRFIPLGFCEGEGQAVRVACELCRLDGQGRVWLFERAGRCVEIPVRRGAGKLAR
jgi:hypothetical protein